jgi:spore germination protein KB
MLMLVICFGCYLGFEVIARTAEIFLPWVLFFSSLFVLFIFISGLPKAENLQPVLENGWKPIVKTFFPTILSFPFGETIVFTLFFPYVNKQKVDIIAGYTAIIFSGTILLIATTIMISVLGPFFAANSPFPLMDTVEKINIGEVFQRLDPIALIMLMIGGFFKITLFFLGAVEGFSTIVKKPNLTNITIPIMGVAVIAMSILMAPNFVEHIIVGRDIVPKILYIPLFMVIPFMLVVIVLLKKKFMKNKQNSG